MVNLPKLFKPFYTISEAFNRLNSAGAGLDKKEDLFLLADQGLIELSLVIYGPATLIKASSVEPYYLPRQTRLNFEPDQESVNFAIESLGYTPDSIAFEMTRINSPSLVIPKIFLDANVQSSVSSVKLEDAFPITREEKLIAHEQHRYDELRDSGYEDSLVGVFTHEPVIAKPLRMNNNIKDQSYGEPRPYKFYRPTIDVLGYTASVELYGEPYYVCEATDETYFSEMVDYVVKFKNGSYFRPIHKLNHALIFQALRDFDNYVVTREALQDFEQSNLMSSDQTVNEIDASSNAYSLEDLFTSPPRTNTDQFDFACEMASKYISKYDQSPSEPKLWRFIVSDERFEVDDQDRVHGIFNNKTLDRDNFKKNFKNWTKPKKN